jgi:hypothetical protein
MGACSMRKRTKVTIQAAPASSIGTM